jgi:hypothetical protein
MNSYNIYSYLFTNNYVKNKSLNNIEIWTNLNLFNNSVIIIDKDKNRIITNGCNNEYVLI